MTLSREHITLTRQVGPSRVDQVKTRQLVLGSYLLSPQMLLHRNRIVCSALDRRVVRNYHAKPALNQPDTRHNSARVDLLPIVEIVASERRKLKKWRSRVQQLLDPLPDYQFP